MNDLKLELQLADKNVQKDWINFQNQDKRFASEIKISYKKLERATSEFDSEIRNLNVNRETFDKYCTVRSKFRVRSNNYLFREYKNYQCERETRTLDTRDEI